MFLSEYFAQDHCLGFSQYFVVTPVFRGHVLDDEFTFSENEIIINQNRNLPIRIRVMSMSFMINCFKLLVVDI